MAIKVVENEPIIDFPILMIQKESNLILLVTGSDGKHYAGIVAKRGFRNSLSFEDIGFFSDHWHISQFEVYHKSITLINAISK